MTAVKTNSAFDFLGHEIEVSLKDRLDPLFNMWIAVIMLADQQGNGLQFYDNIKQTLGLHFGDEKVESEIRDILSKREKLSVINFLGHHIEVHDSNVDRMFLAFIMMVELKYGEGLLFYEKIKKDLGLSLTDKETEAKIKNILEKKFLK